MVIVMLAVMPGRTVFGAPVTEIVTGYETTLPLVLAAAAVGAIAVTLPVSCSLTALTVTDASWPTEIDATSVSATSAVTWSAVESMTIASPEGASRPFVMLTAVTTPSIGDLSVARRIWSSRSLTVLCALVTCVFALFRLIVAWRVWAVVVAASALSWAIASWIAALLSALRAFARSRWR